MIPQRSPSERKHSRCFQRVMSGLEKGGTLRLITLTSSPDAPQDIQRSWRKLQMRLKRRGIMVDYIKVHEETKRGAGHLHICFRGSYIEQRYLSYLWGIIHSSTIVDIRAVRTTKKDKKGVANYLAKYMSKEFSRRYSWSWGWVYKGFVTTWLSALRTYRRYEYFQPQKASFYHFLSLWKSHLRTGTTAAVFLDQLTALLIIAQERAWKDSDIIDRTFDPVPA